MATPAITDPSTLPSQSHLTILFKHHKSTTVLSVSPTQPLPSIKSLLLAVLTSRGITSLSATALPSDREDIEFGILADKRDPSKGWVRLSNVEVNGDVKGKKKTTSGKSKISAGGNTPEGLGLVDGSLVAFRIRKPSKGKGKARESDDEDEDDVIDVDMEDDPGWDVILPSFEDEDTEMEKVLEDSMPEP